MKVKKNARFWTKERCAELKRRYPNEYSDLLARDLGMTYAAVKKQASRMGLRKTRAYCKAMGLPYKPKAKK